jgi:hypothetical protein
MLTLVEVKKSKHARPHQVSSRFNQRPHRASHQHNTQAAHPSCQSMTTANTSKHMPHQVLPRSCTLRHSPNPVHPIAAVALSCYARIRVCTSAASHRIVHSPAPCTSTVARPEGCLGPTVHVMAEQVSSTAVHLTPDTCPDAAAATY